MSNTLTNLIPTLYQALDTVVRELIGFIPAVTRNSSAERVALNETITFPIAPAVSTTTITPGLYAPDDGDQTIATATLTITKSKYAPVRWSGEEQKGVGNSGVYDNIIRDQFTQAMRALVNEVEADLAALYINSSRSVGTAGTAPFGTASDLSDFAAVQRVLDDNGAPLTDRQLVIGSAAMANLRGKQSVLFKVNEAGTEELLRQGIIARVEGLDIHNSAQVKTTAADTGAAYVTSGSTAPGVVSIALITGTGTVTAGNFVTFAADANNKFVIGTGVAAPGTIVLNNPGAIITIPTGNALTVGGAARQNMGFHRSALQLVTRAPAMPSGGDMADDVMEISDPKSGLAFQVAAYRQYRRIKYEVALAWGVKAIKSEFMVNLLG